MDKGQTSRFSKGEMELIRNTFKDEGLLYEIRNVLFQFPTTKEFKLSPEALAIVKKIVLPDLDSDVPVGQQADLYFSLNLEKIALPEIATLHIQAKDLVVEYLTERLAALGGGDSGTLKLVDLRSPSGDGEDRFVRMHAYTFLTNAFMDSCIMQLRTLANSKELTEEEKKAAAKANSSK